MTIETPQIMKVMTVHPLPQPFSRRGAKGASRVAYATFTVSWHLRQALAREPMNTSSIPSANEPSRIEIDALEEPTIVEFGTSWCGYCRAAAPLIAEVLASHPRIRHIKVEDGPGRLLGRSFRVKLWPTLLFMHRGQEVARLVRPADRREMERALAQLSATVWGLAASKRDA